MSRLFVFCIWGFWLVAGDDPAVYRYAVPLTERTYNGEWEAVFEFSALKKTDLHFNLVGYDAYGLSVWSELNQELGLERVYSKRVPARKQETLQSLFLESDQPVKGLLWMHNVVTGQINAVFISESRSTTLGVPHIPRNYLLWKSSLAAVGTTQGVKNGSVFLGYYTDRGGAIKDELVEANAFNHAYVRRTPNVDVLIGGLASSTPPVWGAMHASEGYNLTGFQTFSRQDGNLQTAAVEMEGNGGTAQGQIFWPIPGSPLQAVVLANPNPDPANVVVAMSRLVIDETGLRSLVKSSASLQLEAGKNTVLFPESILFAAESGAPVSFEYSAVDGEGEPLPIYAYRFAYGQGEVGMGSDRFSSVSAEVSGWLDFSSGFEREVLIANTSDQLLNCKFSFSFENTVGLTYYERFEPGEIKRIDRSKLLLQLGSETLPQEGWVSLQVTQETDSGSEIPALLAVYFAQTEKDFALVTFAP
ncbi:MAG: hypothetical protein H6510_01225 [Acidobacteria bacterium]|nr:hypothetical protein [Acidobacteriota bacterium]MCB9396411.1 hypothetical protein [Acidobacteriota bacterium]